MKQLKKPLPIGHVRYITRYFPKMFSPRAKDSQSFSFSASFAWNIGTEMPRHFLVAAEAIVMLGTSTAREDRDLVSHGRSHGGMASFFGLISRGQACFDLLPE